MNKPQIVFALALPAAVGVVIPFVVPSNWLNHALSVGMIFALVSATLCAGSTENKGKGVLGVFLFLTLGTSNPEAKVRNPLALLVFFASVFYLAGLTIGAFAAVS